MGRTAAGVRGIRLKKDDAVVEMDLLCDPDAKLLVVMENGLGKMSKVADYREQSRGGSGVKVANITKKTGKVEGARVIVNGTQGDVLLVAKSGQTLRTGLEQIKTSGRSTQGTILMRPGKGDFVTSLSLLTDPEEEGKPKQTELLSQ
jgi:DNA gyrase subunit A